MESTPPLVVTLMPSAPARAQLRTRRRHSSGPSATGLRNATAGGMKRSACPPVMPTMQCTRSLGPSSTPRSKARRMAIWASSPARSRSVVTPSRIARWAWATPCSTCSSGVVVSGQVAKSACPGPACPIRCTWVSTSPGSTQSSGQRTSGAGVRVVIWSPSHPSVRGPRSSVPSHTVMPSMCSSRSF